MDDLKSMLSSPVGIGAAVILGILLLIVAWNVGKFVVKLVVILLIIAAIAATIFFFTKGGF